MRRSWLQKEDNIIKEVRNLFRLKKNKKISTPPLN